MCGRVERVLIVIRINQSLKMPKLVKIRDDVRKMWDFSHFMLEKCVNLHKTSW